MFLSTGGTSTGAAVCGVWGTDYFLEKIYPGQKISGTTHERVMSVCLSDREGVSFNLPLVHA